MVLSSISTRKLKADPEGNPLSQRQISALDIGGSDSWRIAVCVLHVQVRKVFELSKSALLGRAASVQDRDVYCIDLSPFKAQEMGISRQHLLLRSMDDLIVAIDNNSLNGSWLNGERMSGGQSYPIRHNDKLRLGCMVIQIELLRHPMREY